MERIAVQTEVIPLPPVVRPRPRRRLRRATPLSSFALLAGVALALWTQLGVGHGAGGNDVLRGFAVAAALFLYGAWRSAGLLAWRGPLARPDPAQPPAAPANSQHTLASEPAAPAPATTTWEVNSTRALAATVLGAVTFATSGGNQFTALNVTTWVASVALGLAACWQRGAHHPGRGRLLRRLRALRLPATITIRPNMEGLALAGILLLGAALLYYRIADVPREMTSDHAEKLLDVRDVLDGQHRIFFPRNTGREAVQFYLIALMTPLTGISYLTMKLGTALLAWLALPFAFVLARTLFGTRLALLSTAIMASTRWLLQVARVGLRFPFPPLFGAAIFCFLLRALRDRRRNDFLLCGLALGVAQHTYTALRLAPIAVVGCIGVALLVDLWRRDLPRARRLLMDTALLFGIAILVFVPLGRYAVDQPGMFLFRGVSRLTSDAGTGPPPNVLGLFLDNVKNALLMFNWRGDTVWVNTIPNQPFLDPVSGGLFVLGVAYAVYRLLRFRELPYLYLLLLLFVSLLPSILSLAYPAENPSTVRTGMAIPLVAMLIALPVAAAVSSLRRLIGGSAGRVVAAGSLAALLGTVLAINANQYYNVYAAQHSRSSQHISQVARVVNGFLDMGGRRENVHILPGAHWIDTRLVAIEAGDVRWQPLIQGAQEARADDGVPRPRLFIVHPDDRASLELFRHWYPTAVFQTYTLPELDGNPWFVTVLVPPGAVAATT